MVVSTYKNPNEKTRVSIHFWRRGMRSVGKTGNGRANIRKSVDM